MTERAQIWDCLEQFTSLESIEIDMTEAYCPFGCCRVLGIDWNKIFGLGAKAIRIKGLRHQDEINQAFEEWTADDTANVFSDETLEENRIEINPATDPWEEWKVAA